MNKMSSSSMIEVHKVTKAFGKSFFGKVFGKVVAVSDVSFTVDSGVTALIGPNGSGKSTIFRVICGLISPTRGDVKVLGKNVRTDTQVRSRIGLLPQQDSMFNNWRALKFVSVSAAMCGKRNPEQSACAALEKVNLDPSDKRALSTYSKGMRQRVKLAAAISHEPEVLILDEPLSGLDPVQRGYVIDLLRDLGDEGCCVLVSSHVLDEVARLCSNILVVARGRLVATGDYRQLREMMVTRSRKVEIEVEQPRKFAAALVLAGVVDGVQLNAGAGSGAGSSERSGLLEIATSDLGRLSRDIAPLAQSLDARITRISSKGEDLGSVFQYLLET